MFESLMSGFWEHLTPNLGTLALGLVGIGLVLGIIRKLIDRYGSVKVLISLGAIAITACVARYAAKPIEVEVSEVEKQVGVDRAALDTSATNVLCTPLRPQKQTNVAVQPGIFESLLGVKKGLPRPNSAELRKKAAFDERYSEAQSKPRYEVELIDKETHSFNIIVYERRGEYMVKIVYKCRQDTLGIASWGRRTITAYGKDMQRAGRESVSTTSHDFHLVIGHDVDNIPELTNDLEDGAINLDDLNDAIDRHLFMVNDYQEEQKRREDDYATRRNSQ